MTPKEEEQLRRDMDTLSVRAERECGLKRGELGTAAYSNIDRLTKNGLQKALRELVEWMNDLDAKYFWNYGADRYRAKCRQVEAKLAQGKGERATLTEMLRLRNEEIERLTAELQSQGKELALQSAAAAEADQLKAELKEKRAELRKTKTKLTAANKEIKQLKAEAATAAEELAAAREQLAQKPSTGRRPKIAPDSPEYAGILADKAEGMTIRALAQKYGVAVGTIMKIVHNAQ